MPLSVVIASLDEEPLIGATIDAAFAAGAAEVLVADGGSRDRTCAIARERGARVLECERMRARQLNEGARAATHDELLFLHADTLLPRGAAAAVHDALQHAAFGGFRIAFIEPEARLRLAAMMINLRTFMTRCPWGDQAQFIRRDAFDGFREQPLMEDYELAVRMKRRGPVAILPLRVRTSGRRFLRKGVLRTAAINWTIVTRYRLGADPEDLAKLYRK